MAVTRITFVTKPEQLPKLASGPIHIVLRPNLITNIKKKELKMKYILKEPNEDDRIFKQGFIISQPKIQNIDLLKIPKKMSCKERIIHLIKSLINLGWNVKINYDVEIIPFNKK